MSAMVERLDDWGKPAWIAAMIAGFVLAWPLGLAILGYLIWSGRMGCANGPSAWGEKRQARWERKMTHIREKMERWQAFKASFGGGNRFTPTGNHAFDEYREETIRKLEDEAVEFRDFLERLRQAKDKAQFDQFMTERRTRADEQQDVIPPKDITPRGN